MIIYYLRWFYHPKLVKKGGESSRGRNKVFFCLTGHFWCWQKSPIAIKDFGGAVSPLIDPAFTGNFLHFSDKEVPGFQTINLFTLIKYFPQKNIHPLPSCSQHPWNPRSSQSQHFKRLHDVIKHKPSEKYNHFDL